MWKKMPSTRKVVLITYNLHSQREISFIWEILLSEIEMNHIYFSSVQSCVLIAKNSYTLETVTKKENCL